MTSTVPGAMKFSASSAPRKAGFCSLASRQEDEAADEEKQQRQEGNRKPPMRLHAHFLLLCDLL